ncbi:MAG: tRNA (adenosine(37)-N6)-threonylcarbamoyltransferase complex dimerization subunit type 1 TsaB [Bacilli bacterium]|nr:tRNA (adenosine(37)-N6)-threonylcarbamoyltransferase complex dimerization subunit type 1 TsaB [Bacilli bacterium]
MNYLLLDSSNVTLNVGLSKGGKLIDHIAYPCFQRQSESMVPEIKKILKRNQLKPTSLAGIMVTIGPGSYTGLRIALTIAKVMAFALKIPLYPISTLKVNSVLNAPSIVLFNARSNRSYIAIFNKNKTLLKEQALSNEEVKKLIKKHHHYHLVGDLKYLDLAGEQVDVLANMNALLKTVKPVRDVNQVKPMYLKESYL